MMRAALLALAAIASAEGAPVPGPPNMRNLLYIVYDDLRATEPRPVPPNAESLLGTAVPPPSAFLTIAVLLRAGPDLSAYDVPFMKTPNIQRLADTGLTFERAYCAPPLPIPALASRALSRLTAWGAGQEAVCSPSRNSFTTGRRPNSTKVWNFINQ